MSNDPIKDALKYDLGGHLLNEYTKGIYMKPKPPIVKIGSGTKKGTKKVTTKKKYGGTYKGKN